LFITEVNCADVKPLLETQEGNWEHQIRVWPRTSRPFFFAKATVCAPLVNVKPYKLELI
jgi:hypothetical protein